MSVPTHAPLWAERLDAAGGGDLGGPAYLLQLAVRGTCSFRIGEDDLVHVTRTGDAPDDDRYRATLLDCFVDAGHDGQVPLKALGTPSEAGSVRDRRASAAMYRLRCAVEDDLVRGGYLDPDGLKAPKRLRWWALGWLVVFGSLAATVRPAWLWGFMAVFGSAGLFLLGSAVAPSVVTQQGQELLEQLAALARLPGAEPGADGVEGDRSLAELEDALPVAIVVSRQPEEWVRAFGRLVDEAGYRLGWLHYPSALGAGEALWRLTWRLSESLRAPSASWPASPASGAAAAV